MKKTLLSTLIASLMAANSANAVETHTVYSPDNTAIFDARFYDVGDGIYMSGDDEEPGKASTWNLDDIKKNQILAALGYWTEVLKPAEGASPAIISIGTEDEENASASSMLVKPQGASVAMTAVAAVLNNLPDDALLDARHGEVSIGKMDFDKRPYQPGVLPGLPQTDLPLVMIHELGHAFGIGTSIGNTEGEWTGHFDEDNFNSYDLLLRDDNGNSARPGQAVIFEGSNNPYDPDGFDVRKNKGYLTGENINSVLAGAMPGIPITVYSDDGLPDEDYMSHLELKNSLMSHQNYRNYSYFMEAEMAVLQDLGYQLDRRNFFGHSVYGNDQVLINKQGYFLRDEDGKNYLPGEYNTATGGIGLHIYGKNNTVSQQADLLTKGAGAAGVRVDGAANKVTVEAGTKIHADGLNGRGVMFSYGKDHDLVHRGDIQANHETGIGLAFDFGHNPLGDQTDYRGSWIHQVGGEDAPLLPEVEGALVNNADISGHIAGKAAAIYASASALVSHINILAGASIEGDIRSDYNQKDEQGTQRLTALTFGHLADSEGRATEDTDQAFSFSHTGNIVGNANLALAMVGGKTSLNGKHNVYRVEVEPGATLGGNSEYVLNKEGTFINNGRLSPGNSLGKIAITGDYQQGETGELALEFDNKRNHDTLKVNGKAQLAGTLSFAPQPGWYAANWKMNSRDLFSASAYEGDFNEVSSSLVSPTLSLATTKQSPGQWELAMTRTQNAYSQYAGSKNSREVGQALDNIATQARSPLWPLFTALDFSSADGRGIRNALDQFSPTGYNALFASSLNREQEIARIISEPRLMNAPSEVSGETWQAFASTFGSRIQQEREENETGFKGNLYGVIVGAERQSETAPNVVYGFHSAVSRQSVTMDSSANGKGKATAFDIGVQLRYAEDLQQGAFAFGSGRIGFENGHQDRHVTVGDYRTRNHGEWSGMSGSLMAGGGYRWAVNDNLSISPFASLNYTLLSRPEIKESGDNTLRMNVESKRFNSVLSSVGVNNQWVLPLSDGAALKADVKLSWDHELANNTLTQSAQFMGYRNADFSTSNKASAKDAFNLKTGIGYQFTKDAEISAALTNDIASPSFKTTSGNITATFRF